MSTLIVEVCKVEEIINHENADRLELARVKGWWCVIQKGRYKVGDKVVYIPIDSILPEDLMNILFGADAKIKPDKGRIRTIRIRGAISQGLVVGITEVGLAENIKEGTDVKEKLNIKKYEVPEKHPSFKGNQVSKKQLNPHFRKYTDIENIKHFPSILLGEEVVITEKEHGSNWRAGYTPIFIRRFYQRALNALFNYYKNKYEFVYGSHNVQLQYRLLKESKHFKETFGKNIYWEMVEKYDIMNKLEPNTVLYGEVYGDGIQKNYKYGCKDGEHKLIIIDVMKDGQYMNTLDAKAYAEAIGLKFVPILYVGKLEIDTIDNIDMRTSVLCPEQKIMEGVVIRGLKEKQTHMGRNILKYINPEYLLRKDNTDWH